MASTSTQLSAQQQQQIKSSVPSYVLNNPTAHPTFYSGGQSYTLTAAPNPSSQSNGVYQPTAAELAAGMSFARPSDIAGYTQTIAPAADIARSSQYGMTLAPNLSTPEGPATGFYSQGSYNNVAPAGQSLSQVFPSQPNPSFNQVIYQQQTPTSQLITQGQGSIRAIAPNQPLFSAGERLGFGRDIGTNFLLTKNYLSDLFFKPYATRDNGVLVAPRFTSGERTARIGTGIGFGGIGLTGGIQGVLGTGLYSGAEFSFSGEKSILERKNSLSFGEKIGLVAINLAPAAITFGAFYGGEKILSNAKIVYGEQDINTKISLGNPIRIPKTIDVIIPRESKVEFNPINANIPEYPNLKTIDFNNPKILSTPTGKYDIIQPTEIRTDFTQSRTLEIGGKYSGNPYQLPSLKIPLSALRSSSYLYGESELKPTIDIIQYKDAGFQASKEADRLFFTGRQGNYEIKTGLFGNKVIEKGTFNIASQPGGIRFQTLKGTGVLEGTRITTFEPGAELRGIINPQGKPSETFQLNPLEQIRFKTGTNPEQEVYSGYLSRGQGQGLKGGRSIGEIFLKQEATFDIPGIKVKSTKPEDFSKMLLKPGQGLPERQPQYVADIGGLPNARSHLNQILKDTAFEQEFKKLYITPELGGPLSKSIIESRLPAAGSSNLIFRNINENVGLRSLGLQNVKQNTQQIFKDMQRPRIKFGNILINQGKESYANQFKNIGLNSIIIPKQTSISRQDYGLAAAQIQGQKSQQITLQRTAQISIQNLITPTITQTPLIQIPKTPKIDIPFFFPPFPRLQLPEEYKPSQRYRREANYVPSFVGLLSGIKIKSAPKGILTGQEIRFPVGFGQQKRKKRRRK